jgi:hypothetical protein
MKNNGNFLMARTLLIQVQILADDSAYVVDQAQG